MRKQIAVFGTVLDPKRSWGGQLNFTVDTLIEFLPKIKNDRLYGLGSMDMKANVACLISTFKEVANKVNYPLGLQLVTDEEVGGLNGTKHQVDKGVRANFVIAGETTNLRIAHQAKGILWAKISTKGKTAHGAYPWKGINSIWKMNQFLTILRKKFPNPKLEQWGTTVNLGRIETTNQTFNKIPDNCTIWLDIRYRPEEKDSIVKSIKKMLPKGFKLEVVLKEPAMFVNKNNKYLKILKKVTQEITKKKVILYGAHGSSDARHYPGVECACVEFGPIGGGIGTDKEWVDLKSLKKYCDTLKAFLLSLN